MKRAPRILKGHCEADIPWTGRFLRITKGIIVQACAPTLKNGRCGCLCASCKRETEKVLVADYGKREPVRRAPPSPVQPKKE